MRRHLRDLLLVALILGATLWFMLRGGQLAAVPVALGRAETSWLLLGVAAMAVNLVVDGRLLQVLAGMVQVRVPWSSAMRFSMVGLYYNLVTPLASGSQPAMVLTMTRKGPFTWAEATWVIAAKYVVYQVAVTLTCLVLLLGAGPRFMGPARGALPYAALGLGLHAGLLGIMYLVIRDAGRFHRGVMACGRVLRRLGLRHLDEEGVRRYADDLARRLRELGRHRRRLLQAGLLTVLQITLYFSIGWFLYRAFGLRAHGFREMMALQALLYMAVSFIPVPGGAGASEGALLLLFTLFFPAAVITAYVLLWRGIVFYLCLLASGAVALYDGVVVRPRSGGGSTNMDDLQG